MRQNHRSKTTLPLIYSAFLLIAVGAMIYLNHIARPAQPQCKGCFADSTSSEDAIPVSIQFTPTSYYVFDDTIGGLDYDILRLIEREKGIRFAYNPIISVAEGTRALDNGSGSILVSQLPVTANLREKYNFSEPLYLDRQVLLQYRDSDGVAITNQLQLAGDTVYVVKDSPIKDRIAALSQEIGDSIYVVEDDEYNSEHLYLLVASGKIKYAVINERVAAAMAHSHPEVDSSVGISFSQFHSWAFPKDSTALADSINTWIGELRDTPEFKAIVDKYIR